MQKKTYLKSLMLLTLFAGFFLSVPVANAAKPVTMPALYEGQIGLPGGPLYLPGITTQLGKSHMVRIEGRMVQFTIASFGIFTTTEDSIIDMTTGVGITHGRITVSNGLGTILTAESNGKVFPIPVNDGIAMGFSGHFTSIGDSNLMHVNGEYSGYFTNGGFLHMDFEFQIN